MERTHFEYKPREQGDSQSKVMGRVIESVYQPPVRHSLTYKNELPTIVSMNVERRGAPILSTNVATFVTNPTSTNDSQDFILSMNLVT